MTKETSYVTTITEKPEQLTDMLSKLHPGLKGWIYKNEYTLLIYQVEDLLFRLSIWADTCLHLQVFPDN